MINPSITYQGLDAPPQVVNALLGIVNESCSGLGNYTGVVNGLRHVELSVLLRCRGNCSDVSITAYVIGVEPYRLNYYALWGVVHT
ncbi:hypothetical protein [Vulcanisaeta distributa]|uniref:hypothetical protein n=1 Tax=Vulcanisaeta distributa TaxID=164451 RepID=UPI0006D1445D|nr:hypothetical protein [Vulcanisaeta distributa]